MTVTVTDAASVAHCG